MNAFFDELGGVFILRKLHVVVFDVFVNWSTNLILVLNQHFLHYKVAVLVLSVVSHVFAYLLDYWLLVLGVFCVFNQLLDHAKSLFVFGKRFKMLHDFLVNVQPFFFNKGLDNCLNHVLPFVVSSTLQDVLLILVGQSMFNHIVLFFFCDGAYDVLESMGASTVA